MSDVYTTYPCELCGKDDFAEIVEARGYTNGQPLHVCNNCGFVQVIDRRSPERIAEVWSKELFGAGYTANWPAVKARMTYVADTTDQQISLNGKKLCDIGAGEGNFLKIASKTYGADVFGIEPSEANCKLMRDAAIDCFEGTIEDYRDSLKGKDDGKFDVVTIMWTLENCNSAVAMLKAAHSIVKPGGHLVMATGSRLLVPFKKPLNMYLSKNPADTHSFRFSANTLQGFFAIAGFEKEFVNHFIDTDWLVMIGKSVEAGKKIEWKGDDPKKVLDFFKRWHAETAYYS
jgi:2-polyprenyl-3-methyl-5-hydroxy-6-metoxy-1,4-benzoquinol methylase